MLCYGGVDEEDDCFFDSLDCFQTSLDSVSSEDSVNEGNSDLAFQERWYDIWRKEPMSVCERRKMFFREMGFGELLQSPSRWQCDDDEIGRVEESLNFSESERIPNSSLAVSTSSPSSTDSKGKESAPFCGIRDSHDGPQWPNDICRNVVEEATSNKQRMVQQVNRPWWLSNSNEVVVQNREFSNDSENWDRDVQKMNGVDWWKHLIKRLKEKKFKCNVPQVCNGLLPKGRRMQVHHHKKRCLEFTALYTGQEIQAHKGFIWTMKFSPDGKFLASGGEDGIVRIWRVGQAAGVSCKYNNTEDLSCSKFGVHKIKEFKSVYRQKKLRPDSVVVVPDKVFMIEETPLHEFHGHTCDVLDLSWSKSNYLLSSSEDKTVRLWQVGCKTCLKVFHHNDYVTSIQFNPSDDRYFISGSIDGNIRIWGVLENQVVDWANVHDIITAVCYQPDGQGCMVGSIAGNVRFYDASDNHLQLDAELYVRGKKKPTGKRITGFQFSPEDQHRVLITSDNSKVTVLDGFDVIHKCRGLRNSGKQLSASFTSNGKHIVSVGENSHVYIWNYNGLGIPSSKGGKLIHSCEHFFSEGVLVALPWLGMDRERDGLGEGSDCCSVQQPQHLEATFTWPGDSDRFSIGSWFFNDSFSRASATWPEEKLPFWMVPVSEDENYQHYHHGHHYKSHLPLPETWGMVIVTASSDGMIRSFHNYGLPSRI